MIQCAFIEQYKRNMYRTCWDRNYSHAVRFPEVCLKARMWQWKVAWVSYLRNTLALRLVEFWSLSTDDCINISRAASSDPRFGSRANRQGVAVSTPVNSSHRLHKCCRMQCESNGHAYLFKSTYYDFTEWRCEHSCMNMPKHMCILYEDFCGLTSTSPQYQQLMNAPKTAAQHRRPISHTHSMWGWDRLEAACVAHRVRKEIGSE